ncbi:leucoanthocyanidin dioxygenase isoform X2 [Physcomitrium patens]|uniref:leucoanthocyanidin dioxygenase isoform X2 n=1 Tax=Physcomitrium patens TaxID=3218 RepID=UPI000D15933B|nr:leucoanthocyanidin dioxygenase-like isoform X2 [Physcomitrium patens]|eukprot:XP_024397422.1 leucoanthocyanidin dioxygenase-like isoform X2 [Physcomitrella patens]
MDSSSHKISAQFMHQSAHGRESRVGSVSVCQHDLLVHSSPAFSNFVNRKGFLKDETIPEMDMALFDADAHTVKKNVEKMVGACEQWGYFYLINHGVELELMQKVEKQAYEFFSLSAAEEVKHPSQCSLLGKIKWWSGRVAVKPAETDLDEYNNQLSFSENNHEFSTAVKEYDVVMKKLAKRIVKLLVVGLGVKAWRFDDFLEGVEASLRWNYMPPCPRPENAMGLRPRTDPYLITLQHDSGVGNLQIYRNGKWLGVPFRADALIVNVGDVFEIASPSHRIVVNEVEGRLSVAHCLAPSKLVTLIPPPEILRSGPNQYKARTYAEYLGARKRLGSSNSLEFMKLPTSV